MNLPANDPSLDAVALELFYPSMRIGGLLRLEASNRISDVLNGEGSTIPLSRVRFSTLEGTHVASQSGFEVEKQNLLLGVPRESTDYLKAHRSARFGISRPEAVEVRVRLAVPPFLVEGHLHLGQVRDVPEIRSLPHFFPMTDSTIFMNRLSIEAAATVVVNREMVAGIGLIDALPSPAPDAASAEEIDLTASDLIKKLEQEMDVAFKLRDGG